MESQRLQKLQKKIQPFKRKIQNFEHLFKSGKIQKLKIY